MSARPMTVLQVVPELETGGAERTTIDIAAALVAEGGRALVVSEGGRMVPELEAVGGEHIQMPASTKAVLKMRKNAAHLADLMEGEGVDIIHARSRAPAWSALWAASWSRRPLVTTYHGAYNEKTKLKNRYNSVMARGQAVIANSAYTADLISRRHPFATKRIVTIHRGIDLTSFERDASERAASLREEWQVAPETPILLNLARLTPWKGQEVLLDALAKLRQVHPQPFVCVLAGDDQGRTNFRQQLMTKAKLLGLSEHVRIVGHVVDVPGALAAATVAVQPSVEPEAFGRAAVEAQAAGVPVVVSDHGAVRETVLSPPDVDDDTRTGWRVTPGDAEALAEALLDALRSTPARRETIGARGHAHALTHFSLAGMKTKTLAVYHSLLADSDSALY